VWCVSGNVLLEVKYISILLANLFTSVDILHFDFPFLNLFSHIVIVDMKMAILSGYGYFSRP